MNLVHHRQSLSQIGQTVLPVRCCKTVEFKVLITRKRIKTTSGRGSVVKESRKLAQSEQPMLYSDKAVRCLAMSTTPVRACASTGRPIHEDEMKTRKKNPCYHCSPAALQRSAGTTPIQRIRLLINAACAARAGAGQMTLSDWRDVEQEIEQRLANEC